MIRAAPLRHYIAYMRPLTFPATFVLVATGWAASPSRALGELPWLALLYSVLGWGGANAFNSDQDQDTGPVNLLPDPPPRPPHLGAFGLGCSSLAVLLASLRGPVCAGIAAACLALSTLYSWKPPVGWRGKEIGGVDNLLNAAGCGLLAVMAGWAATGEPLDARAAALGLGFSAAIFGGYPASQIFQLRPGEGYAEARNFATLLGPARALRVGSACFLLHLAVVAFAQRSPASALGWICQLGWAALVLASAVHSWRWARDPFTDPYRRMIRQMAAMLTSQAFWALSQLS